MTGEFSEEGDPSSPSVLNFSAITAMAEKFGRGGHISPPRANNPAAAAGMTGKFSGRKPGVCPGRLRPSRT
jgi:hypothetical protein